MTTYGVTRVTKCPARQSALDRTLIRIGTALVAWGSSRPARGARPAYAEQRARVEATRDMLMRRGWSGWR